MILKLGMQHWGLEVCKVYINDDPGMTLSYFTARSNLAALRLNGKICYKVIQRVKLATNDQINRRFMFLKRF